MSWKAFIASVVTVVTALSFLHYQAFFLDRSQTLSYVADQMANVVGVTIGVEENRYNTVAKQLEQRAEELDSREMTLLDLERQVVERISEERRSERRIFLYVSIVGLTMLSLLLANFYFDIKWRKSRLRTPSVPLNDKDNYA